MENLLQFPFGTFAGGIVVAVLVLWLVGRALNIAKEYERAVVYRLGKYAGLRGPGFYLLIPFVETAVTIDTRVVTVAVNQQESMTKDNVPVKVNAVIWYRVVEPGKAVNTVINVPEAVVQVALTTLRAELGRNNLDDVLKDQIALAERMKVAVDRVTEPWGVSVERVEMRQVEIPGSMQRAMAQVAEAIREKQSRLIKAEAEYDASAQLRDAAALIAANPVALELRRLQMIQEVGAEQNTSTILMIPSEFVTVPRQIGNAAEMLAGALAARMGMEPAKDAGKAPGADHAGEAAGGASAA
jgi:regulator of protease activity HflC (stomatin/prohibitin superfamily)